MVWVYDIFVEDSEQRSLSHRSGEIEGASAAHALLAVVDSFKPRKLLFVARVYEAADKKNVAARYLSWRANTAVAYVRANHYFRKEPKWVGGLFAGVWDGKDEFVGKEPEEYIVGHRRMGHPGIARLCHT